MPINFLKSNREQDPAVEPGTALLGVFEPGVELEGQLKASSGTVRLNSHFKGAITSEGTVVIGERGEVEATIQAKVVSIAGKVKGNVHATERLEIKENGVVLGDIHTPQLTVDPGGYFEGQCQMPSPESPKRTTPERQSLTGPTKLS